MTASSPELTTYNLLPFVYTHGTVLRDTHYKKPTTYIHSLMSYFRVPDATTAGQTGYPLTPQDKQNIIKRIIVCCDGYLIALLALSP